MQKDDQPDPEEIKRVLAEYRAEREKADKEVERATDAVQEYKRAKVQEELDQAPAGAEKRAAVVILELENDLEFQHLEHVRKQALAVRSDWDRRIKLLEKALRVQGVDFE